MVFHIQICQGLQDTYPIDWGDSLIAKLLLFQLTLRKTIVIQQTTKNLSWKKQGNFMVLGVENIKMLSEA